MFTGPSVYHGDKVGVVVLWATKGMFTGPSVYHGDKVGVVEIKGLITEPEATLKALRDFRYDQKIKAVVIRIDSPGPEGFSIRSED